VTGAPVIQGDLRAIPVRTGAVAGCWCVATLVHLPPAQLAAALAELARITAIGGMVVLGTQRGDSSGFEADPYTGQHLRRMTRHPPAAILEGLAAQGFRARLEEATMDELRNWVLVTAIRVGEELSTAYS
jgi:hypothetical protein